MYFRSEKHRELFKDATKKMDKKDNVQMCVEEVKRLYGRISFEDVVRFQKE